MTAEVQLYLPDQPRVINNEVTRTRDLVPSRQPVMMLSAKDKPTMTIDHEVDTAAQHLWMVYSIARDRIAIAARLRIAILFKRCDILIDMDRIRPDWKGRLVLYEFCDLLFRESV